MGYVDGYLLPVSNKKLKAYKQMSAKAGRIWKEHGALDYKECLGEDVNIKGFRPFAGAAKSKGGESVIFAYVLFKSRKHRDAVNARVMKDPRIARMCDPSNMPFDCKRMTYGGFKVIVNPK